MKRVTIVTVVMWRGLGVRPVRSFEQTTALQICSLSVDLQFGH